MKEYNCYCCAFKSVDKSKFSRHLKTKKHVKNSQKMYPNVSKCIQNVSKCIHFEKKEKNLEKSNIKNEIVKPFQCTYCNKSYMYSQGLSKHIKYSCKKNNDEDLKELARLLNEKKEVFIQDTFLYTKNKHYEKTQKHLEKMEKQIEKLTNKLQIQNINNHFINNGNIYNIQLLNFNQTDYSHLTDTDYVKCIKDCNSCVKSLIEKVHFNEQKPENMNIYISNLKGDYAMIYKDKWQIVNKQSQIDDLYNYNEVILENWYEEYKNKYPKIIESFKKYLKNKDEDDIINNIKDEILLLLYNNRNKFQITE